MSMNIYLAIAHKLSFVAALSLLSTASIAQQCDAILAQGVFNTLDTANTAYSTRAQLDAFCDQQFHDEGSADSFGASLNFPFKGIPVGIGVNKESQTWKKRYSQTCSMHRAGSLDYSEVELHLRSASKDVLAAFEKCINSQGLHVWIERLDSKNFNVAARYVNPGIESWPKIIQFFHTDNVKCKFDLAGQTITGSTLRSPCERTNDDGATVTVNATVDPIGGALSLKSVWRPKPVAKFETKYLSDIEPAEVLKVHGGLTRDKVYWQEEVWMGGNRYIKALGMHPVTGATARVTYTVPEGAKWFRSFVGMARQDGSNSGNLGNFVYRVSLNGASVAGSRIRGDWTVSPAKIELAVSAGQLLALEITDGDDTNWSDHAVWGEPRFEP
jgi:hypothetical protein